MTMQLIDIESAAVTDKGLSEKRPQNEDSFINLPSIGLFAVADGVGGAQAGDVASQMATEILGEAFSNLRAGGDAEERMKAAIRRANEAIYQMSSELTQLSTMATTIAAIHINGNIATIGHVGDSRIYRVDPRGHIFRETQDHSVVEDEVRAGRMTAAQAARHPSRNVINRALGVDEDVEVDLKTTMIEPKTTFLICSDGITRHIDDIELRELLAERKSPKEICDEMRHICYSRGAEDNLTAIVVKVVGEAATVDDEATIAAGRFASASASASYSPAARAQENPPSSQSFADIDETTKRSAEKVDQIDSELENLGPRQKEDLKEDYSSFYDDTRPAAIEATEQKSARRGADRTSVVERTRKTSGIAKILGPVALLIAGGAAGAGLVYNFSDSPATTTEQSRIQIPTVTGGAYAAFESSRREVDENPEAYLRSNENRAEDAEDYYLLARASLLLSQYPEAKSFLAKANARLPKAEEANRTILTTDIATAMSIVDNPFSRHTFENMIQGKNGANPLGTTPLSDSKNTRTNKKNEANINANALPNANSSVANLSANANSRR